MSASLLRMKKENSLYSIKGRRSLAVSQLDDQRGPYPEIGQCYHRGSVMIKDIVGSGKFPTIIHTQALCLDANNIEKPSGKTKEKSKPEPKAGSAI